MQHAPQDLATDIDGIAKQQANHVQWSAGEHLSKLEVVATVILILTCNMERDDSQDLARHMTRQMKIPCF
jgi:hypothetical protein